MGSEAKIELYHQTSPGTKNETLKAEGTGTHPMPAPLVEQVLKRRLCPTRSRNTALKTDEKQLHFYSPVLQVSSTLRPVYIILPAQRSF